MWRWGIDPEPCNLCIQASEYGTGLRQHQNFLFVDKDGSRINPQSTSLPVGRHTVTAEPEDLLDGYSIATEPNVTVEVYEDGAADPLPLHLYTTRVELDPTEEPQPSPASNKGRVPGAEDNHEVAAAQTLHWAKARYRFPQHQKIWKRGISWTVPLPRTWSWISREMPAPTRLPSTM